MPYYKIVHRDRDGRLWSMSARPTGFDRLHPDLWTPYLPGSWCYPKQLGTLLFVDQQMWPPKAGIGCQTWRCEVRGVFWKQRTMVCSANLWNLDLVKRFWRGGHIDPDLVSGVYPCCVLVSTVKLMQLVS